MKKNLLISLLLSAVFSFVCVNAWAFWVWDPKSKKLEDPKHAVKDTPQEQYDWGMKFFKGGDFKRAAEEFIELTDHYKDSDYAPEARYYAGRSYEELGKYFFAYEQYQKIFQDYPYTKRLEELLQREFNIANIFQAKSSPKLMDLELNVSLEKAVTIYGKIVENSPFSKYADQSLFNTAECYRRLRKYKEAIDAYDKLISDYPSSSLVQEAKYQLAQTTYEASLEPEYDQENTEAAMRKFEKISQAASGSAVGQEAEKVVGSLRNKKADSLLVTAAFYEKQGKFQSAVIYYQDVVDEYPETGAAKKAAAKVEQLNKRIKKK
jgi:outer membrane assembly lipoprotein YfiO